MSNRLEGDVYVNGNLSSKTATLPAGTVTNAMVNAGAAIEHTKLRHQHRAIYAQESGTDSADASQTVFVVYGATATVVAVKAGSITACTGDSTITVDVKKNGTSILTGVISLDSANTARVVEAGTIATPAGVAGDVYEVVVNATVGTGALGKGVFAAITFAEDPQ